MMGKLLGAALVLAAALWFVLARLRARRRQTALLRENFHVLVLRENGQLVTANVEPRQEDLENLRRTVDRAVVQPVFQTTGSDTEGELSLLGRSGGYYIEVSTQLDPIFSVAMTFTRYSIATGVIVWFATLLLVVAIERQLFQPIGGVNFTIPLDLSFVIRYRDCSMTLLFSSMGFCCKYMDYLFTSGQCRRYVPKGRCRLSAGGF